MPMLMTPAGHETRQLLPVALDQDEGADAEREEGSRLRSLAQSRRRQQQAHSEPARGTDTAGFVAAPPHDESGKLESRKQNVGFRSDRLLQHRRAEQETKRGDQCGGSRDARPDETPNQQRAGKQRGNSRQPHADL